MKSQMAMKILWLTLCILEGSMANSPAPTGKVAELTDDTFKDFVTSHEITMVTFYSRTCPHCKNFAPLFDAAAADIAALGRPYHFARIDVSSQFKTSEEYTIRELPTIKLFLEGTPIESNYERGTTTILQFIDKYARIVYRSLGLTNATEIVEKVVMTKSQVLLLASII